MAKELCRDLVGRRAKMLREIRSRAGTIFRKGSMVFILSTYRGKYELRRATNRDCISRVCRSSFEIQ